MRSRRIRIGLGSVGILATAVLFFTFSGFSSSPARAAATVASGSGAGFTSQTFTVATTGTYDFNFHLKSAAGFCAELFQSTLTYESATVDLVSTSNATAMSFSTGPLVAWEVPNQSLAIAGDQEVSLAAGIWTLRISWTCFNGGELASAWSYSIS